MNGSYFLRTLATLSALAFIGAGILISSGIQERKVRPKEPALGTSVEDPFPERLGRPPPDEPTAPENLEIKDYDADVTTLDAWLSRCRGHVSTFPTGTPEYERSGRTLRALFRADPYLVRKAAGLLVEDRTLEQVTRSLIVEGIARSDDADRAESTLRDLLLHPASDESTKVSVLGGFAAMGRLSEASFAELIRCAGAPDRMGRQTLETLGKLHRKSTQMSDSMRRELAACVFARHAEFLGTEELEGLQSTLRALAQIGSPDSMTRFKSALRHGNSAIRTVAVKALSAAPDRHRVLLDALTVERDPTIRVEAIKGLYPTQRGRSSAPVDASVEHSLTDGLLEICREDRHEGVRRAALEFFALRFHKANLPPERVTETIRGLMSSDAAPGIREYAEWILRERFGFEP